MQNTSRDFITKWNVKYPFDRVWREKYKIPFLSEQHKQMSLEEIKLDIIEDEIYSRLRKEYLQELQRLEKVDNLHLSSSEAEYIPNTGNFLRSRGSNMTEEEEEDLFNKIKI